MSDDRIDPLLESVSEIRITRLNTDKTRKDIGSESVYHVYFELSGHPPQEWRNIFGREWKRLNPTQEPSLEGACLVVHCQLHEVATTLLPALKKTVTVTNQVYGRFVQKEVAALKHREDVWKEERKDVDAMAASLRFE